MALSADDFIHENSGSSSASTSVVVALAGADSTTAGNTVIVVIYTTATVTAIPAGFEFDAQGAGTIHFMRKSNVGAAETSWTFTLNTSSDSAWYVVEMFGVDDVEPFEVSSSNTGTLTTGQTLNTDLTADTPGQSTFALACHASTTSTGGITQSWGSQTNGFEEIAEVESAGTTHPRLVVARKFVDGVSTQYGSTATLTHNLGSGMTAKARVCVWRADGTHISAPIGFFTGFEQGTHGGLANVSAAVANYQIMATAVAPTGTWGTHYLIQAGSARNGAYGLRITTSAASCYVPFRDVTWKAPALGFNVRVVSATGTVNVATVETDGTDDVHLVYNASTTKYGLRWGSGTVSYQAGTTALNTWVWIDIRLQVGGTSTWHADWRIETGTDTYSDEASPTDLTGLGTTNFVVRYGLGQITGTQTVTMDFDDIVESKYYPAYPLGPHVVVPLKVDPAGTATVSGTTGNFNVFTANGTLAAWNATNARNAIDELPPTVSASADGVVQITTAASDYMQFPMETYTCAEKEFIAAVRMVASMWGGAGSATGTLAIKGYDGTTEFELVANTLVYDAASPTALSATDPIWHARVWTSGPGWTQTELDNAALRVGYSSDATPDMGISAIYLEVAIGVAMQAVVHRLEEDKAITTLRMNAYNSSSVSYLTENNDGARSVQFRYWIGGVEQGPPAAVTPGNEQTVTVNAAAFGDVDKTSLEWV